MSSKDSCLTPSSFIGNPVLSYSTWATAFYRSAGVIVHLRSPSRLSPSPAAP